MRPGSETALSGDTSGSTTPPPSTMPATRRSTPPSSARSCQRVCRNASELAHLAVFGRRRCRRSTGQRPAQSYCHCEAAVSASARHSAIAAWQCRSPPSRRATRSIRRAGSVNSALRGVLCDQARARRGAALRRSGLLCRRISTVGCGPPCNRSWPPPPARSAPTSLPTSCRGRSLACARHPQTMVPDRQSAWWRCWPTGSGVMMLSPAVAIPRQQSQPAVVRTGRSG